MAQPYYFKEKTFVEGGTRIRWTYTVQHNHITVGTGMTKQEAVRLVDSLRGPGPTLNCPEKGTA